MLMATAEIAASHSHTSTRPKRRPLVLAHTTSFNVLPLVSAVYSPSATAWPLYPYAQAQVVADPNAAANLRPQIFNAANGVPLINIQTPSAAGVSRNVYRQLDVQSNGAILDNARNNAQTQLGGWVQGNPNLASGTARVILNEVNSNNSSQLRGFISAGDRAQVVIANRPVSPAMVVASSTPIAPPSPPVRRSPDRGSSRLPRRRWPNYHSR